MSATKQTRVSTTALEERIAKLEEEVEELKTQLKSLL